MNRLSRDAASDSMPRLKKGLWNYALIMQRGGKKAVGTISLPKIRGNCIWFGGRWGVPSALQDLRRGSHQEQRHGADYSPSWKTWQHQTIPLFPGTKINCLYAITQPVRATYQSRAFQEAEAEWILHLKTSFTSEQSMQDCVQFRFTKNIIVKDKLYW